MCDMQTGPRESVILMSNRKNQEEHLESCDLVYKDQNIEEIMEDIKDNELTCISKDDATNDIDDDELIFKYIHKARMP